MNTFMVGINGLWKIAICTIARISEQKYDYEI